MTYKSVVPSEADDIAALGQATYSFAYLEWQVVWVVEKLQPGFVAPEVGGMMAGTIARAFTKAAEDFQGDINDAIRKRIVDSAKLFGELVDQRNHLIHARPITDPEGKQRLFRNWRGARIIWTAPQIDELCKEFDDLASELNDLFYHWIP